jgi:hypothetical protein
MTYGYGQTEEAGLVETSRALEVSLLRQEVLVLAVGAVVGVWKAKGQRLVQV